VFQPFVRGSCDGGTVGWCGESCNGGTHKSQEGASGGCDAHAGSEISVGTLQAR
jgi:hypothetical protein